MNPMFEVSSKKYNWMNDVGAAATRHAEDRTLASSRFFEVL